VSPHFKTSTPLSRPSNFAGIRLKIEYLPIEALNAPQAETRKPSAAQEKRIADSIKAFGFFAPAVIYGENVIACGAARVRAAQKAGLREVPVVRLEHLTNDQARLLAIADNKLAEGRKWDVDKLRIEFAEISISSPELNLGSSGFSIAQRDIIFGRHREDRLTDLDDVADGPDRLDVISQVGDRFTLGSHSLVCGSATDPDVITVALDGEQVRTVASDLPFNVKIGGNVSGLGKMKHREFVEASGEMSKREFNDFLVRTLMAALPHIVDGGLLYLFMDWRHLAELLDAASRTRLDYLNLLVWAKTNAGMGSFYRSAHEMIGVFKKGGAPHINNVNLGRDGRSRTNVLHYPGASSFGKGRAQALSLHPTVKPVSLMADLILDSTSPGDLVLDMFGGSGTTLIAAERTGRRAALVELDPVFVDIALRRFEKLTGKPAIHAQSGMTFAELTTERSVGEER